MSTMIDVPSGGAYFEGHFPGRPILPGVAQLALILEALAREARRPVPIQGIAFTRLRQLVLPGDRLDLEAREQEASRLRIDLKRDGVLVANGEFILGSPSAPPIASSRHTVHGTPVSIPPLDELLPHRPPMRFLKSILQQTANGLLCTAHIPRQCVLVSGGSVPAVVSIEAAAQAAAAWEALQRGRNTAVASPRIGYLVALRDIDFFTDRLPADRDLLVSVTLEAAAPPLTHYRIEVSLEGMLATRGTIATFLAA